MRPIALLTILAVTGCMTTSYVPPVRYVLNPIVEVSEAPKTETTLAIRALDTTRAYKQAVVYRDGNELSEDLTHQWAELPRDTVTRVLTDALVASNHFADVGDAIDLNKPDLILTGQLRRFDLNRIGETWQADCEIRVELRQAIGRNLLYGKTLSASHALASNDVKALPAAMEQSIAEVVGQAATDIIVNAE